MMNLLLNIAAVITCMVLASGCYTQLGSTRDETATTREPDYTYQEDQDEPDADEGEYADEYELRRDRFYWDYYYPSATVFYPAHVYSPWRWRHHVPFHAGIWWEYDPWWNYSAYYPYWVCGTYYPTMYAGWWYPMYDPWWGGYPYYGGSYGYGGYASGSRGHGSARTIGVTRDGGGSRGGSLRGDYGGGGGGQSLPGAYRNGGDNGNRGAGVPPGGERVSTGRGGSVQEGRGSRGSREGTGSRGGSGRSGSGRGEVRTPPRPPVYSEPPRNTEGNGSTTRGGDGSGRNSGGRSSGGRGSYSPPAQSSPPPSSPPPSAPSGGSGRERSSSGGRGR